jgi:hypothetical protein
MAGRSRRTRRSHTPLPAPHGRAVVGALRAARWAIGFAAACEADRGARAAPTRHCQPRMGGPLWERCVQRDGRSGLRQVGRPIAAHAPLLHKAAATDRVSLSSRRLPAVVAPRPGRARACRRASPPGCGFAEACEADRGARAAPTRHCQPRMGGPLWERCVQRDGRSSLRQVGRPIAAHAPLLHKAAATDRVSLSSRRLPAVVAPRPGRARACRRASPPGCGCARRACA